MSVPKKHVHVEILTTLDEEPKLNFFPWEVAVRNAAATICKTISPRGLLSLVLTDPQWNVYPANLSVDAQGQQVIAPRYNPPVYVEINNTMTSVEVIVTKSSNDQLLEWITGEEALKTAIVKSLGPIVRQIIGHPEDGFTLFSIRDIMDRVHKRYGKMRQNTKSNLEEQMTSRLTSTDGFDTHVANLRQKFLISEKGGYSIQEYRRVEFFKMSVAGHVLIDSVLRQFDFENKDELTHTFEDMVTYIEDHLPNLQSSSKAAAQATANILSSEAYLNLEAENKALKAAQVNTKKRDKGGKGKGKNKRQKKNRSQPGDKNPTQKQSDKKTKYCWVHGTQHTHTSSECKLMAGDKAQFNEAMRSAKDADHPPGGSIKVLGQEPK
jgi:hypothetical protein